MNPYWRGSVAIEHISCSDSSGYGVPGFEGRGSFATAPTTTRLISDFTLFVFDACVNFVGI